MLAALAKLPICGNVLELSDLPEGVLHKIEFNDLSLISVDDFVWLKRGERFTCMQVKQIAPLENRGLPQTVSYEMMCHFPKGSVRTIFKMGQKTNLFYIDVFFLHRYLTVPTLTSSADIVSLKDKQGGS